MSEPEWSDEVRDDLLAELRADILGELRLQKREPDSIPDSVLEVLLDELPEDQSPVMSTNTSSSGGAQLKPPSASSVQPSRDMFEA